jgi:hypothetical protein
LGTDFSVDFLGKAIILAPHGLFRPSAVDLRLSGSPKETIMHFLGTGARFVAVVILASSLFVMTSRADNLTYTMTGSGDTVTFQLPTSFVPGPCTPFPDCFGLSGILVTINGVTTSSQVDLFTAAVGGGIIIEQGSTVPISLASIQGNQYVALFTGTVSDPVLSTGSWYMSNVGVVPPPVLDHPFDLNVTPTPEPASLLLLGASLMGVLGMRRKAAGNSGRGQNPNG